MNKRLLYVDANLLPPKIAKRILEGRHGWTVDTVSNARAARQALSDNSYDVALVDPSLPNAYGLAILVSIREMLPNLPLGMVTGFAPFTSDEEFKVLNIPILPKPFSKEDLVAFVDNLIDPQHTGQADATS